MATPIMGGFFICAYSLLRLAVNPNWQDTEAYFGHSLYIAEHGGVLAEFFWTAKIINLVTGLIALATLIFMVARRYGRGPALVALAAGWTVAEGELTEPRPLVHQSPSYAELIEWLNQNIEARDRALLGPTTEFCGLLWMVESPPSVIKIPNYESELVAQRQRDAADQKNALARVTRPRIL